jgi:hypothetical protein
MKLCCKLIPGVSTPANSRAARPVPHLEQVIRHGAARQPCSQARCLVSHVAADIDAIRSRCCCGASRL